jgi:hypothetical protein
MKDLDGTFEGRLKYHFQGTMPTEYEDNRLLDKVRNFARLVISEERQRIRAWAEQHNETCSHERRTVDYYDLLDQLKIEEGK